MDAFEVDRLRTLAWHHFEAGRFETADILFRRAFELEHAPAVTASSEVVL